MAVTEAPVLRSNLREQIKLGPPHGFQLHVLPVKWVGTTAAPVRVVATVEEAEP
jgi:kynurenine formamidase